ncbi:MAG: hypothetical protein BGO67_04590 [Alphaproteobacteria bacterium 41-28]|mgnify:CR=1 FL=1|nr:MAG: hypothetical protein BGO67_04590 [Alphaproteobacteria bacterium 41-28]
MFSRIIFSLLTTSLLIVPSVFAMEQIDDTRASRTTKKEKPGTARKRYEAKRDEGRTANFLAILDLYKDQADHHQHMKDLLTQLPEEETSKFVESEELPSIIEAHRNYASKYAEFVKTREELLNAHKSSVLPLIASLYHAAVSVTLEVDATFENFQNLYNVILNMEEIFLERKGTTAKKFSYKREMHEDELHFYTRIQRKILEDFSSDLPKLYDLLIDESKCIKKLHMHPLGEKKSASVIAFCDDLIRNKYKFPSLESLSVPTLSATESEESEESIPNPPSKKNTKKNARKKLNRRNAAQITGPQKQSQDPAPATSLQVPDITEPRTDDTSQSGETSVSFPGKEEPETDTPPEPKNERKNKKQSLTLEVNAIASPSSLPEPILSEKASDLVEEKTSFQAPEVSTIPQRELSPNDDANLEIELKKRHEDDRKAKIALKQNKNVSKKGKGKEEEKEKECENKSDPMINSHNHAFLTRILYSPVYPNLRWRDIITLFTSPSGFKGKVLGTKKGAAHTFVVFLYFKNGELTGFLSENDFNLRKQNALPELYKNRTYLRDNKKLECYKISEEESIATTSFTLHNPHPEPFAYRDLVQRLQEQLFLLGITSETVKEFRN